ncbi:signal peptidase I [Streptosporangium sp. NPDC051022]|uniref:signal peptidase I n=1 Tax=Streptosporangium sp. NPDC051022 TaxID=3155752 RepID=UPI00344A1B2F
MHVVAEDVEQPARSGKKSGKKGSFWRELPIMIVVALLLALLIKTFIVQAFYIPSGSMENTLQINDRVLVNKLVYHVRDIERGDIVVFAGVDSWKGEVDFEEPTNPVSSFLRWTGTLFGLVPGERDYIKRVIGVAGDKVKCCDAQGRITVNGVPLDEKGYLFPGNKPSDDPFEITVPAGRLWVMGDHRGASSDSRAHQGDPGGGAIPADQVIGRAFVIVWPFAHASILSIPDTFSQPALRTVSAIGAQAPILLGLAGAVPLVRLRHRLSRRKR